MMMERRLAALEGTSGCIATSSGMAAIMLLVMVCSRPATISSARKSVFGSTIRLLQGEFSKFGRDKHVRLADRCGASGRRRSGPTPGCCSPNRRPTR